MLIVDMPIEADLVDRRVLHHNLEMWQDSVYSVESLAFLHEVKMFLASAPHIKAQELVRCGECMFHSEPRRTDMGVDVVWCNFYNTHKIKDGYCNCGERKDGEKC